MLTEKDIEDMFRAAMADLEKKKPNEDTTMLSDKDVEEIGRDIQAIFELAGPTEDPEKKKKEERRTKRMARERSCDVLVRLYDEVIHEQGLADMAAVKMACEGCDLGVENQLGHACQRGCSIVKYMLRHLIDEDDIRAKFDKIEEQLTYIPLKYLRRTKSFVKLLCLGQSVRRAMAMWLQQQQRANKKTLLCC